MASSVNNTTNVTTPSTAVQYTADYVGYVTVPLFFIMGVVGNALTVRIMLTKGFRSMPVSKILIALSVSDTIVNLMLPFNKSFVRKLLNVDIRAVSAGGCKLFYWTYRVFKFSASWLVVLISCERFVAVWLHVRAKSINTTRNAYIAIAALYGFSGVYVGYWCSFADNIVRGFCIPNASPAEMAHILRGLFVFGVIMYVTILPILLVFLNSMIVYKLIALKRKKTSHVMPTTGIANIDAKKSTGRDSGSKTNAMLLCVAIAFIVLETPIGILHIVSFVKHQSLFETKDRVMVILLQIAQVLEQLNHSINFLLYVLASKRFRDRFITMLIRTKRQQVEDSNTTKTT